MTCLRPIIPFGVQPMKALLVTAILISVTAACGQEPSATTGWPFVGSDQAHTKYSVAEEITAANVSELEIVWKWEPNETPLEEYGTQPGPFQALPSWSTASSTSPRCTRGWRRSTPRRARNSGRSIREPTRADLSAQGRLGSSTVASRTGATATTLASSSTAATGCTQSTPRPVNRTLTSARAAVSC